MKQSPLTVIIGAAASAATVCILAHAWAALAVSVALGGLAVFLLPEESKS